MNEQVHRALEEAIKSRIDAERSLSQYDEGRKPLLSALRKARERCRKLEDCIYTGEYQPELGFEAAAQEEPAPTVPMAPRETTPTNFFGKRQRTTKGAST